MRPFERLAQPLPDHTLATPSWIQFKADGAPAVYGSENVAALTDNGSGDFTVTWAIPYAGASSYAVTLGTTGASASSANRFYRVFQSITASSVQTLIRNGAAAQADPDLVYIIAMGEH